MASRQEIARVILTTHYHGQVAESLLETALSFPKENTGIGTAALETADRLLDAFPELENMEAKR